MQPIEPIKITASQAAEWEQVISAMTFHTPAFSHLMFSLLDTDGTDAIAMFTDQVPVAATDGKSLLINPTVFFSKDLSLANRLFVTCHEVLHVALEHLVLGHGFVSRGKVHYKDGKSLPYKHDLMNQAMDYIVNAVLIHGKIGQMPTGKWQGLYDPSITRDGDVDLTEVYRMLYKQSGGKGGSGKDKPNPLGDDHGGGFCQHAQPGAAKGKNAHDVVSQHNSEQVKAAVAAAANAARVMGKLPGGLARILDKLLEPTVNWREHIQSLLARKAGSGGYDWSRGDDELLVRDIFAPARSGHGIGTVVCVIDTSGSVSQADYDLFYGNVAGMLADLRPRLLHIIWCDYAINKSEEIDDAMDLLSAKIDGGGGTSFVPAFQEVERLGLKPDALIYLTDGQGTFPASAPDYHVIWGSIYEASRYPWGDVVSVPRQAQ